MHPTPMKEMSDAEKIKIMNEAIISFNGSSTELESALGFFYIGFYLGWKPLYIMHSKKTVRKYENILGIKVRDIYPDASDSFKNSPGWRILNSMPNFWKAVSGEIPFDKSEILNSIEYSRKET